MFQCIKYEDKREVFGFKIHSFSTLDRIKKYDDSDNGKSAEKPYSIEVGEIERTINLYAIAQKNFSICFTAVDYALKIGYNVLKHTIEEKNTSGLM